MPNIVLKALAGTDLLLPNTQRVPHHATTRHPAPDPRPIIMKCHTILMKAVLPRSAKRERDRGGRRERQKKQERERERER